MIALKKYGLRTAVPQMRKITFGALRAAVLVMAGCATVASAQSWADGRAHDKGCAEKTRIWHVRCEFSDGSYSLSCPNRSAGSFRGVSVVEQSRLPDKAWAQVETADTSCGWPVTKSQPIRQRAIAAMTAIDLAWQIRAGTYDSGLPVQELGTEKSPWQSMFSGGVTAGARGTKLINADEITLSSGWPKGSTFVGVENVRVYRRWDRHYVNFAIFSTSEKVVVALWGTDFEENLPANFGIVPVANPAYGGAMTHPGYASVAYDIWPVIKNEILYRGVARKDLIITGHSMGGSVAGHLMYLALQDGTPSKTRENLVLAFAAPRLATNDFKSKFEQFIATGYQRTAAYDYEVIGDKLVLASNAFGPYYTNLGQLTAKSIDNIPGANLEKHHSHLNYFLIAGGSVSKVSKGAVPKPSAAPSQVRYGEALYVQNKFNGWETYLDVNGAGCEGGVWCVSAAASPDRVAGAGTGTWRIEAVQGDKRGANLRFGDEVNIRNAFKLWGTFLTTSGAGCEGNRYCVSTTSSAFRREKSVRVWRIVSATGKPTGAVVQKGDEVYLQNKFNSWETYLDANGAGCEGNRYCVSAATSPDRTSGSGTGVWRFTAE